MTVFTVTQGDSSTWTIDFIDPVTNQRAVVPGGNLTLSYHVATLPFVSTISLVPFGVRWQANWLASPADLGYGTWSVTATGGSQPSASGTLRIVTDP